MDPDACPSKPWKRDPLRKLPGKNWVLWGHIPKKRGFLEHSIGTQNLGCVRKDDLRGGAQPILPRFWCVGSPQTRRCAKGVQCFMVMWGNNTWRTWIFTGVPTTPNSLSCLCLLIVSTETGMIISRSWRQWSWRRQSELGMCVLGALFWESTTTKVWTVTVHTNFQSSTFGSRRKGTHVAWPAAKKACEALMNYPELGLQSFVCAIATNLRLHSVSRLTSSCHLQSLWTADCLMKHHCVSRIFTLPPCHCACGRSSVLGELVRPG